MKKSNLKIHMLIKIIRQETLNLQLIVKQIYKIKSE